MPQTPFGEFDHPEAQPDEVWVNNCERTTYLDGTPRPGATDFFDRLDWQTKRRGCVAYGQEDAKIMYMYPVFVQRSEWEARRGYSWEQHYRQLWAGREGGAL